MQENSENTLVVNKYSFRVAYDSLPRNKQSEARGKIKKVFGVKTDKAVWARIAGITEPKVSEAAAIEQLFLKNYGIKVIWGA